MTGDEFVKSLMALTAWREGHSDGINGMVAVLFVIKNRVDAGWGDWVSVIKQPGQFQSMSGCADTFKEYPDIREPEFQKLLQYVDGVYDGALNDKLTNGALYFANLTHPAYSKHGSFQKEIVDHPEKHPRVSVVGSTTFFK